MTRQRGPLYALLVVVAVAAAVLSFAALRDLALLCGFAAELAWLLPVVVDAGAAAGSLVWLARWTSPTATRYGRTLALLLLGSSVGGNALGHGLSAYGARPHWLVVVGVSAIAPAVLGALVHLVVLVGRPVDVSAIANLQPEDVPLAAVVVSSDRQSVGERKVDSNSRPVTEREPLRSVPTNADPTPPQGIPVVAKVSPARTPSSTTSARVAEVGDRAAELIAAGAGRNTLAKELGITPHEARTILEKARA